MRANIGATNTTANHDLPPAQGAADQLLRAMTDMLVRQHPASAAEALRALRRGYPEIPLALRIAALRAGAAK